MGPATETTAAAAPAPEATEPDDPETARLRDINNKINTNIPVTEEEAAIFDAAIEDPDRRAQMNSWNIVGGPDTDPDLAPNPLASERRGGFWGALGRGIRIGFRRWLDNINPANVARHVRDRDSVWLAGFGIGALESVTVAVLPSGVDAWVRTAVNLALVNGTHVGVSILRGFEESRAAQRLTGDELAARQERIAEKYGIDLDMTNKKINGIYV